MHLLLSAILLSQEEGGGQPHEPSGTDLILPEGAELLWGLVSFVIVAAFLMKVAWPRIQESIDKREQTIQGSLEEAEGSKNEAHKLLEEYKEQLAEARSEANRIIEDGRQQAEQVRKDLIARAERDAEGIVERAQEQILAERNRTVQQLQGQIASLSIELAEKVVGRSLDGEAQRDLVDAYIREVSGMQSGNGSSKS